MSANCEMFEITATSDVATISGLLNGYPGAEPGKVVEFDLELGQQLEITAAWASNSALRMIVCKKGSATGGSTTTLVDTTANWPPGFFDGKCKVVVYSGTGAGLVSSITSNTADTLTFPAVGAYTVDSTSKYAVVFPTTSTFKPPTGGVNEIPVITAWDTGTYTLEFATVSSVSSWGGGRAGYLATQTNINGGTVPLRGALGSTYDSTRDCFWACDGSGWLVQIDSNGYSISRTQPGMGNSGLCYDPVNDVLVFVTTTGNWGLIDPDTKAIIVTVGAGGAWNEMTFCPVNNYVYTSAGWVLDAASQTVIAHIAGPGAFSYPLNVPTDNTIWYVEYLSTTVRVIDTATQAVLATISGIPSIIANPQGAYCADNGLVYLGGNYNSLPAFTGRSTVHVIDPTSRAWVRDFNIFIPSDAASILYNPVDHKLYITCEPTGGELCPVLQIDPTTETEIKRFLGPPAVFRTRVSTAGYVGLSSDTLPSCMDCFAVLKP